MESWPKIMLLSAGLGAALYFFFLKVERVQSLQDAVAQIEQSTTRSIQEGRTPQRFEALAFEARSPAPDPSPTRRVSDECEDQWTQFLRYDLTALDIADVPATESCAQSPSRVEAARLQFERACSDLPLPDEISEAATALNAQCLRSFVLYRAEMNHELHAQTPLLDISDPSTLLDLLIAAQTRDRPVAEISAVARRLHELEPGLYEPVKTLAVNELHHLSQAFKTLPPDEQKRRLSDLGETAEEAWNFGQMDPQVFEARIAAKTEMLQNPDAALEVIEEAKELNVLPELTHYYEALIEQNRGNHEQAIGLLKIAAESSPNNGRILRTLKLFETSSPGDLSDLLPPLIEDWNKKPQLPLEFDLSPDR